LENIREKISQDFSDVLDSGFNNFINDLGASSSKIILGYNNLLKKIEKLEHEIKKLGEKVDEIPDKIKSN
jgi:peptidoglycan hydrolase CwlO-like protein